MKTIELDQKPNQSVEYFQDNNLYIINFRLIKNTIVFSLELNGELLYSSIKLIENTPLLPISNYRNFILITDGAKPDWKKFNSSQRFMAITLSGAYQSLRGYMQEETNAITRK